MSVSRRRSCRPGFWWAIGLLSAVLCSAWPLAATPVRFFRLDSRDSFLQGSFDGVAVDDLGRLSLADTVERLAELGEPFLFSAARHPEGWVFGTGNAGKVLLVTDQGEVSSLFEAPEPEVFAVWADADGTVFAGTSPSGKVYRLAEGRSEVWFDPEETYIWDFARGRDGSLLVATGTRGRLFRVTGAGRGELLFDSEDTHIRSLAVREDGSVLAGTAGEGLILSISEGGFARTLYDAAQPEVVDLALGPEGVCFAALLASEASLMDLSAQGPAEGGQAAGSGGAQVVVSVSAPDMVGSRPQEYQGPRSEIVRLTPQGRVESLWRFAEETAYAVRWHRDRLWVGTGLDGKLYSLQDGTLMLEKDVDERQIVALLDGSPGPAFGTANATALYRVSATRERRGSYTSPALDAEQIAEFGSLSWLGGLPQETQVRFSFRSGMSASPDRTWSPWTPAVAGREVSLGDLPAGRYLQWRTELVGDGVSPGVTSVTVSYRQLNLPPRIESFTAMDPGEILVPASFNPSNQAYEPAHPNRQGIFTTLEPARSSVGEASKTLWKRGYRTLRWEAADPNGDSLVAGLWFRSEQGGPWMPVAEGLEESSYSFDATVLPDGVYRFRLVVADRGDAGGAAGLEAEQVSAPVLIDHTPPRLGRVQRQGELLRVGITDALNPLREAVVSVDAGEWRPVRPADGLVDGRAEELLIELPQGARLVLLRASDAAFNVVTFELLREEE